MKYEKFIILTQLIVQTTEYDCVDKNLKVCTFLYQRSKLIRRSRKWSSRRSSRHKKLLLSLSLFSPPFSSTFTFSTFQPELRVNRGLEIVFSGRNVRFAFDGFYKFYSQLTATRSNFLSRLCLLQFPLKLLLRQSCKVAKFAAHSWCR